MVGPERRSKMEIGVRSLSVNLLMRIYVMAIVWLLISCQSVVAVSSPKTVAFVVGVLNYDASADSDLNKLQYTAKDAEAIYRQIEAVTDFQSNRSRLLLAVRESVENGTAGDNANIKRRKHWEASEIENEFKDFLATLKDYDNVIIYFGGHGIPQGRDQLLFLASDYAKNRNRYLRYSSLINELRESIEAKNYENLTVTFFANMCGSGTASAGAAGPVRIMSDNDDGSNTGRVVKEWLKKNALGFKRFAFFPASAPGQNTFEKDTLGRSVLAHYLLKGLSGTAAKNGAVRTGELFDVIAAGVKKETGQEIDRHQGFDREILLGITRTQDALAAYSQGVSLLGIAQETGEEAFADLAVAHLRRVPRLGNAKLASLAQLRLVQGIAAFGGPENELKEEIIRLNRAGVLHHLSERARRDADSLIDPINKAMSATPGKFPTFKSFTSYLKSGKPFYSIDICMTSLFDHDPCREEADHQLWSKLFSTFPGMKRHAQAHIGFSIKSKSLKLGTNEYKEAFRKKTKWFSKPPEVLINEYAALEPNTIKPPLIVIYDGFADVIDGRLLPFGLPEFDEMTRSWNGPVVVIYVANYPGFLLTSSSRIINRDFSMFLVGQEKMDLTIHFVHGGVDYPKGLKKKLKLSELESKGKNQSTWFMVELILQSPETIRESEVYKFINSSRNVKIRYGTPTWIASGPHHPGPPLKVRSLAKIQLQHLANFSIEVAGGCIASYGPDCDIHSSREAAVEAMHRKTDVGSTRKSGLLEFLTSAGQTDMTGRKHDRAGELYRQVAKQIDSILRKRPAGNDALSTAIQNSAKHELKLLRKKIGDRIPGVTSKSAPDDIGLSQGEIRIIGISVQNYDSPLIPDLQFTKQDVEALAHAIEKRLAKTGTAIGRAVAKPVILYNPKRAEDIREFLKEQFAKSSADNLNVLIYSGRGFSRNNKRYLTSAGIKLLQVQKRNVAQSQRSISSKAHLTTMRLPNISDPFIEWADSGLVELGEIARLAEGNWFLGIYDAQFDRPELEANRIDSLYDKHIDSVRPLAGGAAKSPGSTDAASRMERSNGSVPDQQVHIYWDGRLTEPVSGNSPCKDKRTFNAETRSPASPLSSLFATMLRGDDSLTYEDFGRAAMAYPECDRTKMAGRIVLQGELGLPVLASGRAANQIVYFANGFERKNINLKTSHAVANIANDRFPTTLNALTLAGENSRRKRNNP